jgi:signal transduction histidine kinase
MRERATLAGGSADVASQPGAGTTVRVELPLTPPRED